ncbi:hypothetical protein EZS27_004068 [termite gut metagenome]|uniref:Uncharacterized protein n=1 Tax=termite gut metagenome TaxID=433724 RepID=A0A5J4SRB7_9ZZZZ
MSKSRITGIDALIQNTEKQLDTEKEKQLEKPQPHPQKHTKMSKVCFDIPVTLKKEMGIYCVKNDISIKDFIADAIKIRLGKE